MKMYQIRRKIERPGAPRPLALLRLAFRRLCTAHRLCTAPLLAALLLAALVSCAGLPQAEGRKAPEGSAPARGSEDGLESRAFAGIPEEARSYLKTLSAAFAAGDEAFLISQGEAMYEKLTLPHYDKEVYLALLYRIGPYATEDGAWPLTPLRLNPAGIRGIQYLGWEEESFLIEIQGQLLMKTGAPLACRILLHWKLDPPKIIGETP